MEHLCSAPTSAIELTLPPASGRDKPEPLADERSTIITTTSGYLGTEEVSKANEASCFHLGSQYNPGASRCDTSVRRYFSNLGAAHRSNGGSYNAMKFNQNLIYAE